MKTIGWHVPHFTPSLENHRIVMDELSNKVPTELYYMERIVFRKDVNTNYDWTFELGNVGEFTPTFVKVEFQARNKIDSTSTSQCNI